VELVSDLSTALAALASLGAVFIAVKALRATRNAPVADHLLIAYGEMIAALQDLSVQAYALEKSDPSLQTSREVLDPAFRRLTVAEAKLDLLEPPITKQADYGEWVRTVAHNLGTNLRQADEWATLREDIGDDGFSELRPQGLTDTEWLDLRRSASYLSILLLGLEPPGQRPAGFVALEPWFRPRVSGYGDGTGWDDLHSVYSPHAGYMVQNARLLDDFVREYLIPWARQSVRESLD
jgi:hypothetical protein